MQLPRQIRNITPDAAGEWGFLLSSFVSTYLGLRLGIRIVEPMDTYLARLKDLVNTVLPLNANGVPDLSGFAPDLSGTYHEAASFVDRQADAAPNAVIARQIKRWGGPDWRKK